MGIDSGTARRIHPSFAQAVAGLWRTAEGDGRGRTISTKSPPGADLPVAPPSAVEPIRINSGDQWQSVNGLHSAHAP